VAPKKLVMVDGGHFDAYTGAGFEVSSGAARDWFVQHLIEPARGMTVHHGADAANRASRTRPD
jgi:hypothetical protein